MNSRKTTAPTSTITATSSAQRTGSENILDPPDAIGALAFPVPLVGWFAPDAAFALSAGDVTMNVNRPFVECPSDEAVRQAIE